MKLKHLLVLMSAVVSLLPIACCGHEAQSGSAAQAASAPASGDSVSSNARDLTCRATDVAVPQGESDRSKGASLRTGASRDRINEEGEEFGREAYRMLLAAAAIVLFLKGRRKSGDWV